MITPKNKPSPAPAINLPANNCASPLFLLCAGAEAHNALPNANIEDPKVKTRVREMRSESDPATTEVSAAVMSMHETTSPCKDADIGAKDDWN